MTNFHSVIKCELCQFACNNQSILNAHIKEVHPSDSKRKRYPCEECNSGFDRVEHLLIHIQDIHSKDITPLSNTEVFSCSNCNYTTQQKSQLDQHSQQYHSVIKCNFCHFSVKDESTRKEHVYERHPEVTMFHTTASQVNTLSEKIMLLDAFKADCMKTLNTIVENQLVIKQEMFLIRNELYEEKRQSHETPVASASSTPVIMPSDTVTESKET